MGTAEPARPTDRFLLGRDAVRDFLMEQGDQANFTTGGLNVTRTDGDVEQLVVVEWNTPQGVIRFLAVAPLPKIPPDCHDRVLQAVSALSAELALGRLLLFRGRVSVHSHAFLNHDGSVSARVIESSMRLIVETGRRARARLLPLLAPNGPAA